MTIQHIEKPVQGELTSGFVRGKPGDGDYASVQMIQKTIDGKTTERLFLRILQDGDRREGFIANLDDELAVRLSDSLIEFVNAARDLDGRPPVPPENAPKQTVTTQRELNNLPRGSFIQGHDGFYHTALGQKQFVIAVEHESHSHDADSITLPATILYMPTEPAKEA